MNIIYFLAGIFIFLVLFSLKMKRTEDHLRHDGLYPADGAENMEHVKALLEKGYKIQAIKIYRKIHGVGLKEAKEAVEKIPIERKM